MLTPVLSDAETSTLAVPLLPVADVIETVGGFVSTTLTVNVPVALLPNESVAVHVTVVVPIEKVEPDAGVQTGVMLAPVLEVAVAE